MTKFKLAISATEIMMCKFTRYQILNDMLKLEIVQLTHLNVIAAVCINIHLRDWKSTSEKSAKWFEFNASIAIRTIIILNSFLILILSIILMIIPLLVNISESTLAISNSAKLMTIFQIHRFMQSLKCYFCKIVSLLKNKIHWNQSKSLSAKVKDAAKDGMIRFNQLRFIPHNICCLMQIENDRRMPGPILASNVGKVMKMLNYCKDARNVSFHIANIAPFPIMR